MDFVLSAQAEDVRGRTWDFTRECISPAEPVWDALRAARGHDDRGTPPLQEGTLRSAFARTEPDMASSDGRNMKTSIVRDGNDYVVESRRWITGTADERCGILILMGKTGPDALGARQQSIVLVPRDNPAWRSCAAC